MAGNIITQQPAKAEVSSSFVRHEDVLDELWPFCSIGFLSMFWYTDFPACVGGRLAGDACCCTLEADCCRILCEDSHEDMKQYENDWCMCYEENLKCGDCKTCFALQFAVCCCECRCALPTNSETIVPWIVNFFGFTLWFQWSFPCSFLSTIGELKDATAADEPWCGFCNNLCGVEPKDLDQSEIPMERGAPNNTPANSATSSS